MTMDFALLPDDDFFAARPLLASINKPLECRLTSLPSVLERVRGAVMFSESASRAGDDWPAAAYLRAGLADLVSIEEVQQLDRPTSPPLKIRNCTNPLVHLLALVRHLNIHVKSVVAIAREVPANFGGHEFDLQVCVISNLTVSDFQDVRNVRYYSSAELQQMIDWFQVAQLHWGAGYLLRIGAESLAAEVATHHGLPVA
jgi:hypothetical protein